MRTTDSIRRRDLICIQRECSKERGSYGPWGTAADNGCGAIALYNLLCLLGRDVSFEQILAFLNRNWRKSMVLGGLLGTSPCYLLKLLRKIPRTETARYFYMGERWGKGRKIPDHHQVYLNFYIYRFGAHYTVSEYVGGKLKVYNDAVSAVDYEGYYRECRAVWMMVFGMDVRPGKIQKGA